MSSVAIYNNIVDTLGIEAMAYSPIISSLRVAKFPAADDCPPADEQINAYDEINMAITTILAEYPFSSIRDVSRLTHISKL
jgi:hypothetical protein